MGCCTEIDKDGYIIIRDECLDCKHSYTDELDPAGLYCKLTGQECCFEQEDSELK